MDAEDLNLSGLEACRSIRLRLLLADYRGMTDNDLVLASVLSPSIFKFRQTKGETSFLFDGIDVLSVHSQEFAMIVQGT